MPDRVLRHVPPPWLRGPACLDRGDVVLDRTRAEEYHPSVVPGLACDLAAITRPSDVLPFVRRWGLLWHGPQATTWREAYRDWEREALTLRDILHLHLYLQRALRGDASARQELWRRWARAWGPSSVARVTTEGELYAQVSQALARAISERLEGVQEMVTAAVEWESDGRPRAPGTFLFTAHAPHLLGYAYHDLALQIVTRTPMSTCIECGRVFVIKDQRQQYCSAPCGGRARYRRWAEKHRASNREVSDATSREG